MSKVLASPAAALPAAGPLQSPGSSRQSKTLLAAALIALACLLAYANSLNCPFIFDDALLWDETAIHHWPPQLAGKLRPMGLLTFATNYALHGHKLGGYHVTNLAIHVLAACTLFGVVRRTLAGTTMPPRLQQHGFGLALAVALCWAVHPLQTQSVTYVAQRFESLMGLFYLLTLYCFLRAGVAGDQWLWYGASICACGLGMLTKEVMVTCPVLVLWYDRAFVASSWRELAARRWGYYLGLLAVSTYLILPPTVEVARKLLPQVMPIETSWTEDDYSSAYLVKGLTPLAYLQSQPGVIVHYLKLSLWPRGQCLDYGWPIASTAREILPPAIAIGALLLLIACLTWRRPKAGFLGGAFFLILAPTSSFIPIRDLAFEHRMYLPLACVVTAVILGGFELLYRSRRYSQPLAIGVTAALVLVLGTLTHLRNWDYWTEVAIWDDVAQKRPEHYRGHLNLAESLVKEAGFDPADSAGNRERYAKAVVHYRRALQLKPESGEPHYKCAVALEALGQRGEAIAHYRQAVRLDPDDHAAQNALRAAEAAPGGMPSS